MPKEPAAARTRTHDFGSVVALVVINGGIMTATRLLLALLVLGTAAPDGYSQLLPRRRVANGKGTLPEVERRIMEFGAKVTMDALTQGMTRGMTELSNKIGWYLDLRNSFDLYARCQMDPELRKRVDGMADRDLNQAVKNKLFKEPAGSGSTSICLAETDKFAEKLRSDGFSTPVLRKMYLEYHVEGVSITRVSSGDPNKPMPREIAAGQFRGGNEVTKGKGDRRVVTCYESLKPKDPKNNSPDGVHCSFVFTAQKDGKELEKTLSFDLSLEEMKPREGGPSTLAWKALNVQYK
jgi:hypothetical protein